LLADFEVGWNIIPPILQNKWIKDRSVRTKDLKSEPHQWRSWTYVYQAHIRLQNAGTCPDDELVNLISGTVDTSSALCGIPDLLNFGNNSYWHHELAKDSALLILDAEAAKLVDHLKKEISENGIAAVRKYYPGLADS
jgi:hypothetical protein